MGEPHHPIMSRRGLATAIVPKAAHDRRTTIETAARSSLASHLGKRKTTAEAAGRSTIGGTISALWSLRIAAGARTLSLSI